MVLFIAAHPVGHFPVASFYGPQFVTENFGALQLELFVTLNLPYAFEDPVLLALAHGHHFDVLYLPRRGKKRGGHGKRCGGQGKRCGRKLSEGTTERGKIWPHIPTWGRRQRERGSAKMATQSGCPLPFFISPFFHTLRTLRVFPFSRSFHLINGLPKQRGLNLAHDLVRPFLEVGCVLVISQKLGAEIHVEERVRVLHIAAIFLHPLFISEAGKCKHVM